MDFRGNGRSNPAQRTCGILRLRFWSLLNASSGREKGRGHHNLGPSCFPLIGVHCDRFCGLLAQPVNCVKNTAVDSRCGSNTTLLLHPRRNRGRHIGTERCHEEVGRAGEVGDMLDQFLVDLPTLGGDHRLQLCRLPPCASSARVERCFISRLMFIGSPSESRPAQCGGRARAGSSQFAPMRLCGRRIWSLSCR